MTGTSLRRRRRRLVTAVAGVLALSMGGTVAYAAAGDTAGPSLREAGQARGILVGAAVTGDALRDGFADQSYLDTLKREFSLVSPENDMKWSFIHPEADRYDFAAADKLVAMAQANGQKIHGHTLAWYSQNPAYVDAITDKAVAEKTLEEHIKTVVGRYKGKIAYWDVVNEAINDNGRGFRDSVWLRTIGPSYIEKAFRWAHEADPSAKLYYNDYENADLGAKSNADYDLLRGLKAKGVPIDGVGIQAHSRPDRRTDDEYARNLNRLAALGLQIQITELDVGIAQPTTPAGLTNQARVYRETAEYCLRQPACVGITTWGFTDKYSWIPTADPGYGDALEFDATYQRKPAYHALRDALLAKPGTPVPPAGVVAETADRAVQLSWVGTVAAGTTGEIRYGTSPRALSTRVPVSGATTTRITGLRNGRTYYFAVVARGPGGASAPSPVVSAKPVGTLARPVLATPRPDHRTLELRWKPIPGATAYVISHGTSPDTLTQRTDVGNVTRYRLGGLTNDQKYSLTVRAYNADGDGPASATRTGTPATQDTPTLTAPETTGVVTVDGKLTEPEWKRLPIQAAKPTYRTTDATARAAITWDTERVYLAARVTDPVKTNDSIDPWQDTSVEFFLNGRGDLPKTYDTASDRHYFLRWHDPAVHEQNGKTAGATYAYADTRDGWTAELSVTWKSLGIVPPADGTEVGVDVAVNSDPNGGPRDGQKTAFGFEENYLDLSAIGLADLTVRYATTRKAVVPVADCVIDNGDGSYTAHFSYTNQNNGRVVIPVGRHNQFTPAPADRGQPAIFARETPDGFYADFDGKPLTWRLRGPDGETRSATADRTTGTCAVVPAFSLFRDAPATGWTPFSYNATVDPAATGTVHSGTTATAITVTGAYGLGGLENKTAPVKLTPDTTLELWINVGASSGPRTFGLTTASGIAGAPSTPAVYFTVQPGSWVKKTFDYADLGRAEQLASFFVQDVGGSTGTQPTVYLDDVRVLNVKPA